MEEEIKNGTNEAVNVLVKCYQNVMQTSVTSDNIKDVFEDLKDFGGEVLELISYVKALTKLKDIPSRLFLKKFERFCRGIVEIPVDKRQDFLQKVNYEQYRQDTVFILNIINRIEEEEKIPILIKLVEAMVMEKLDSTKYRRFVVLTDRTLYSDLIYMKENIRAENFEMDRSDIRQEGLLSNGWITSVGIGITNRDPNKTGHRFAYTITAKEFCEIVFGSTVAVEPPDNTGVIQFASNDDIDEIVHGGMNT